MLAHDGEPTAPGRRVTAGMLVVGADGRLLGRVKTVRSDDFLLDRELARDIYVPLSAVELVGPDLVSLNVPSYDVDQLGWEQPPPIA